MDQKTYYNRLHRCEIHIRKERMSYIADRFSDEMMWLAGIRPGDKILDVGSGEGCLEQEYKEILENTFVVGIDVSYEALKLSKARYRIVADASTLPLKDDIFDKVLSRETLEHMDTIHIVKKTLSEMNRVLKKGGIASLSTPNGNCLVFFFTNIVRGRRNTNPTLHPTMLTKVTLERLMKNSGFNAEIRSYLFPVPVPRYEYMFPKKIMHYLYYMGRLTPSVAHGFIIKAVKK